MDEEEEEEVGRVRLGVLGVVVLGWVVGGTAAASAAAAAAAAAGAPAYCHHYRAAALTAVGSNDDVAINITHHLFDTDRPLVPGLTYQVGAIVSGDVEDLSVIGPGEGVGGASCYEGSDWWTGGPPPLPPLPWTPPPNSVNITFRIRYRLLESSIVLETTSTFHILQECELWLAPWRGELKSGDVWSAAEGLDDGEGCGLVVPGPSSSGLLVTLTRLNVPCRSGRLSFPRGPTLCGKLQELPPADRTLYFPPEDRPVRLFLKGRPTFSVLYRPVDYCYRVSLSRRNDSFEVTPGPGGLECQFGISLPYGYRVSLDLRLGGGEVVETEGPETDPRGCSGLLARLTETSSSRDLCCLSGDPVLQLHHISVGNKLSITVTAPPHLPSYPTLSVRYEASGVKELTQRCSYPWVASGPMCLRVVESESLSWAKADLHCNALGGHLASIRSETTQNLIDTMLINSPGYRDENAYWVGGTDSGLEGDFRWSDDLPFTYTNWFPGWRGEVNRQPNDDGLSGQDCIELRRLYHSSPASTLTPSFTWNDRDCSTTNYFICEKLSTGEKMEPRGVECNRTVELSSGRPRVAVTSPGFSRQYPDDAFCIIHVNAPPGYRILVDFEELVLEKEPTCSYDVLEIEEGGNVTQRLCGDWSTKLKLLRYVSSMPKLLLRFISDYSNHYGGFKARLSIEHATPECGDDRLLAYNHSCYLFVSYPEVTWHTAREICRGMKGDLASILTINEDRWVAAKIRESREYSTSAVYWLGAKTLAQHPRNWFWADSSSMTYTAWISGGFGEALEGEDGCLALQWLSAPTPELPSGLYWRSQSCDMVGGYVCKKINPELGNELNLNTTTQGDEGSITSPLYPLEYPPNLDYWTRIESSPNTRLVMSFSKLDLEYQPACLYDYLELSEPKTRLCGPHTSSELKNLRLVSGGPVADLHFRSDYSVAGRGFSLAWKAVDVSACPLTTLTASKGNITSPNYPDFLLPHLDCSTTILAPEGRRVWLEMKELDAEVEETVVEVSVGAGGRLQPFFRPELLSDGVYVSTSQRMQVILKTGDKPRGKGFWASYRTVGEDEETERILHLTNVSNGQYLHINYPLQPPEGLIFTDRIVAPVGHVIHFQFHNTAIQHYDEGCLDEGGPWFEVWDGYADVNGTVWRLCEAPPNRPPISIQSFFNTISIRQIYHGLPHRLFLNASLVVKPDVNYKIKLIHRPKEATVDSCLPNPCLHGGKCVSNGSRSFCQCTGHYMGMFCGLTFCEEEPCQFGVCRLRGSNSWKCECHPGYQGKTCNIKYNPCVSNPCDGRGDCVETLDQTSFKCICYAWYEGNRCERRMHKIPYKPLSARMLQEPFWLGLITVTIVLAILGLFWCAKRHFPEKLEKLLAEDDRNRPYVSWSREMGSGVIGGCGREQRTSLLGRLGIRKPSLTGTAQPTSRTFSLDDLLKPPPTTPSPRKKRNNSTPTKKSSAVEKKQILQQLVAPAAAAATAPATLQPPEAIPLSCNKLTVQVPSANHAETSFTSTAAARTLDQAAQQQKLEKKVTFARLLDKVSFEMAEGMAASGSGGEPKSPNSTSSNQGSDSQSSSELQLNTPGRSSQRCMML